MRTRVSIEDLDFAAEWLQAYEGYSGTPVAGQAPEEDDEQQARLRRVAAWIEAEIVRRKDEALIRSLAKGNGVSVSRVRQALRKA